MSSPWAKIPPVEPINLQDIMSEQVAKELQVKEDKYIDYLKEYQNTVDESDKFYVDSDSEDEQLVDIFDKKDWDRFDSFDKTISLIPCCDNKKPKKNSCNMVTKYEVSLSGRINTSKLIPVPSKLQVDDSEEEQSTAEDEHSTAEIDFDLFIHVLLYKFINNHLLERISGVFHKGKNSIILHADSDPSYTEYVLPKECAIKVCKRTSSEFEQCDKYINDDHHFKYPYGNEKISRKQAKLLAEKEMANLIIMKKIGVPCPEAIALKTYIVVMSFIGNKQKAAPKLMEARLKPGEWFLAYEQVVEAMKKLYSEAKMIHTDFSERNILWHDNKCWFVGLGESVEATHPNGFFYLLRNCTNIYTFFTKCSVREIKKPIQKFVTRCCVLEDVKEPIQKVKEPGDLFAEITGYDFYDRNSLPISTDNPDAENIISPNTISSSTRSSV